MRKPDESSKKAAERIAQLMERSAALTERMRHAARRAQDLSREVERPNGLRPPPTR